MLRSDLLYSDPLQLFFSKPNGNITVRTAAARYATAARDPVALFRSAATAARADP